MYIYIYYKSNVSTTKFASSISATSITYFPSLLFISLHFIFEEARGKGENIDERGREGGREEDGERLKRQLQHTRSEIIEIPSV